MRWATPPAAETARGHLFQCSGPGYIVKSVLLAIVAVPVVLFLVQSGKIGIALVVGAIYWFLWNGMTGRNPDA